MKKSVFWLAAAALMLTVAPWMGGGSELVAMLISVGMLFLASLLVWAQPNTGRVVSRRLSLAIGTMIGWAALSMIWSVNSFSGLRWLVTAGMIVPVFYLSAVLSEKQQGRRALEYGYLALAGLFCVGAIIDYVLGSFPRLVGTFYWPNPAAAFLLPALFLLLYRVSIARGTRRWSWIVGFGLIGAAFILTDSRGALLVFVPFCAAYILWRTKQPRSWINIVFALCVTVILAAGVTGVRNVVHGSSSDGVVVTMPGMRMAGDTGGSTSIGDRIKYLKAGWEIIVRHPALGTGAGTFRDVHPYFQEGVTDSSANMHNYYVQLASELGLIGLAILIICAYLYWNEVRNNGSISFVDEDRAVALGLMALLFHFALDINGAYPALMSLSALLGGRLYGARRTRSASGRKGRVIVPYALAIFVIAAVLYQNAETIERADAAMDEGDFVLAAGFYEKARNYGVINPDALTAEGIVRLSMADSRESSELTSALELAREAERRDRYDSQHYQLESKALSAAGEYELAVKPLQRALVLDQNNRPELALDLADLFVYLEREDEAMRVIETMNSKYNDAVIRNRAGNADIRPSLAALWALSAKLRLEAGDREGAVDDCARALQIYPDSLRGRALKARLDKL